MGEILIIFAIALFFLFLVCLIPLLLRKIFSHKKDGREPKLTFVLLLVLIVLILITFAPLVSKITLE